MSTQPCFLRNKVLLKTITVLLEKHAMYVGVIILSNFVELIIKTILNIYTITYKLKHGSYMSCYYGNRRGWGEMVPRENHFEHLDNIIQLSI